MIKNSGKREAKPFLRKWGWLCLSAAALFYYALYWRSGLMLSGEDGVAAVVAQRLNAGQRPIVDTFLGYNVGWFYPVAWIFWVFGPSYLLLRLYFFLMALASGLAAYALLRMVTRREAWALSGGLCVILMPGMIGRNYMGTLGILGILAILWLFVLTPKTPFLRALAMIVAGISISLSWLVRIDLGVFQTLLFLLAAILCLIRPAPGFCNRFMTVLLAGATLFLSLAVIHGMFYRDAADRGFGKQFLDQYLAWPQMIRNEALQLASRLHKPALTSLPAAMPTAGNKTPSASGNSSANSASHSLENLKRPPLSSILRAPVLKDRLFAIMIYLPGIVAAILAGWGFLLLLKALVSRDEGLWKRGGILLVTTGGSLVLFPQYFFWRPDMIHLAEFMVPFMATLVAALFLSLRELTSSPGGFPRILPAIVFLMASLNLGLYLIKGWQTDGTGSIASARRRHLEFTALNGVRVKLNPSELALCTLLRDTIASHSSPGEYVVCYPYYPMVNFMTDRPTYEYNLYADNSLPPDKFHKAALRNMEQHLPAVIVIGTGKINATEASRFPNWASRTYDHIRNRFTLIASDPGAEIEIYVARPQEPPAPRN